MIEGYSKEGNWKDLLRKAIIEANKNCYGDGFLYEDGEVIAPCNCKGDKEEPWEDVLQKVAESLIDRAKPNA